MAKVSVLMVLPPVLFAGLAAMFYVGMYRDDPEALPSTLEGKAAPAVQVEPLGNLDSFDDATLRTGGAKLVNYWASWCGPCRVEHPTLEKLSAEGVVIYGVNYKDQPGNALNFLDELGNPYTAIGADSSGRMALNWGLYGVPETFVINGEGKVILRFAGPVTERVLAEKIRPALEEAGR